MKLLLYSGLLYLAGVAIILLLQPKIMFTEDGQWKEFGIGRNPRTHTWLPFWLFSVIWAIISYIIVLIIAGNDVLPGVEDTKPRKAAATETTKETPLTYRNFPTTTGRRRSATPVPGYYILDRDMLEKTGVPKYIYLGEEPHD